MIITQQVAVPGKVGIGMRWSSVEEPHSFSAEKFLEMVKGNIEIAFPGVPLSQVMLRLDRPQNKSYDVELIVFHKDHPAFM